jgi:hypothetical protein
LLQPSSVPSTRIGVLGVVVLVMGFAAHAYGQVDNKLAVGLRTSGQIADSSKTDGAVAFSVEWRWNHDKPGWAWQMELFNWFDTGVNQPIAGQKVDLGQIRIRPFMGGYGYTWTRGRTVVIAELVAGYAFASFDLDPAADDAYRARMGARGVTTEAGNTFVVNPELIVWHDVTKRIGVRLSAGFMVARPSVTMISSLGEDKRRINADTFIITVGVVHKIF